MGHVDMPFEIPNLRVENGKALAHTRIGWFRSVSNIPRAFAVQSFAAELAHELGRDEKEMLLELIGSDRKLDPPNQGFPNDFWNYGEVYDEYPIDTARLKNVLNLAADKAGWGKEMPAGEGLGLAVHRSFVTYVAAAVHVKIVDGKIRVPEVHLAVDCGFAANPERIRSQMEGAAVMGMTLALHSGITYENGAVVESNFNDYDVVRSDNFPEKVHTHIVEHPFSVHASGVGEPGVPPIAPSDRQRDLQRHRQAPARPALRRHDRSLECGKPSRRKSDKQQVAARATERGPAQRRPSFFALGA